MSRVATTDFSGLPTCFLVRSETQVEKTLLTNALKLRNPLWFPECINEFKCIQRVRTVISTWIVNPPLCHLKEHVTDRFGDRSVSGVHYACELASAAMAKTT